MIAFCPIFDLSQNCHFFQFRKGAAFHISANDFVSWANTLGRLARVSDGGYLRKKLSDFRSGGKFEKKKLRNTILNFLANCTMKFQKFYKIF